VWKLPRGKMKQKPVAKTAPGAPDTLKGTFCQCCAGIDYGTKPSGSIKGSYLISLSPLLRKSEEPNF